MNYLVQVLKGNKNNSYGKEVRHNHKVYYDPIACGEKINAATLLAQLCVCGDVSTVPIKRIIGRFASNTLQSATTSSDTIDSDNIGKKVTHQSILEYAVNQSISRDLTRRALNFQTILSTIRDEDSLSMDFASSIFELATRSGSNSVKARTHLEECQQEIERLSQQCQKLT